MDVHEKTLWSSIPHVFDPLSTIHTTQGQEIAIGRVVHKHFYRDFCTSHHLPQMDWHDRGAEVSEGGHGGDRHVGHLHQADCRRLHHALHEHRGEMTKTKTHSEKQVTSHKLKERLKEKQK